MNFNTMLFKLLKTPIRLKLSDNYNKRCAAIGYIIAGSFFLILFRYAYLSVLPTQLRHRLVVTANRQFETEVTLAPPRAAIQDRQGRTLAMSVLQPSLFIVPKRLPKDAITQSHIIQKLGITKKQYNEFVKSKKSFTWIKRQMSPKEWAKIGDISDWHDFAGVIEEPKRIYPEGALAAHLLGFVGVDNRGLEGVEKIYDSLLAGTPVTTKVTRDARGRVTLTTPNGAVHPEPSTPPLRLSLDISIQSFTESALRYGVENAKARGGSAVVMDVATGELLAIASYPGFDLNDIPHADSPKRRFRPLMDALELGSVVKPIFIAKALDWGVVKPREGLFCENGSLAIPGGVIRDDHPHGWLTIGEVIKFSSNICTYKIIKKMGRERFFQAITAAGFIRPPATGLPGEWAGKVLPADQWKEMRFANMAFGQGIALSPLQITRALAMTSNGGKDPGVKILSIDEHAAEEHPNLQFISQKTSRIITQMMTTVVEEEGGTGRHASIPGVTVAGKTGTSQKFSQATRSYSERIASFIGVFPAESPRIAITVVIDEPQVRPAYGGLLAGPVFAQIGEKVVRYLNSQGVLAISPQDQKGF